MKETNYDNQAPIFRFLKKHKWRIIIPLLLTVAFLGYKGVLTPRSYASYSCDLFVTSNKLENDQLNQTVINVTVNIQSDESLENLMFKYDLLPQERAKGQDKKLLLERLRRAITIGAETENMTNGGKVWISLYFKDENPQKLKNLADEIIGMYESSPGIQVAKYTPPVPKTHRYEFHWEMLAFNLFLCLLLISTPLILIWEIPNLFYTPKTQETVFNPIKSDWQNELTDAKLRNQTWKAFEINIRYSFAFLSAMLLKSPLGSLIETVKKIAG